MHTATNNPLIDTNPADTLAACAAVLTYVANAGTHGVSSDDHALGQYLTLMTVRAALRYEAVRAAPAVAD